MFERRSIRVYVEGRFVADVLRPGSNNYARRHIYPTQGSSFTFGCNAPTSCLPAVKVICSSSMTVHDTTIFAERCAVRAERVIAALEAESGDSPDRAELRHDLRGRLGTLRSALDVLEIVPASSDLAMEANAIAQRHAAQLNEKMDELAKGDHGKRSDR
jgi:hypothetical protein